MIHSEIEWVKDKCRLKVSVLFNQAYSKNKMLCIYIYIYICVCVCVCINIYVCIYI